MKPQSLLQLSRRGFLAAGTAITALGQQARPLPEDVDLTPEAAAGEQHYNQPLRPQFHHTPISFSETICLQWTWMTNMCASYGETTAAGSWGRGTAGCR